MTTTRLTLLLLAVMFFYACNKTAKQATIQKENQIVETNSLDIKKVKKIESYTSFYKRFHADSVFQMNRIKFPIGGYYTDTLGNEHKWNRDSWIMHRSYIQDADTSIYNLELTDEKSQKSELLFIEGAGFKVERKFKQINGKWYLVYYVDENL